MNRSALLGLLSLTVAACSSPYPRAGDVIREAPPPTPQVAADPERGASVRLELAAAYFNRGQTEVALNELKQVLAIKPDMGDAYNLRGLILSSLGDDVPAVESFRRAIQLNPRDADSMHNLGWHLCERARYEEADAEFERALAVPQYRGIPRTMMMRGVCQARAGALQLADRSLTRAHELDPNSPAIAFNLADVLYRRGDLERARFFARRVNNQPGVANAQTLWLAVRIENRIGNVNGRALFGKQLREQFPLSNEALKLERGQFDE